MILWFLVNKSNTMFAVERRWPTTRIAEIIVYDTALDDAERTTVEMYLKSHWAY